MRLSWWRISLPSIRMPRSTHTARRAEGPHAKQAALSLPPPDSPIAPRAFSCALHVRTGRTSPTPASDRGACRPLSRRRPFQGQRHQRKCGGRPPKLRRGQSSTAAGRRRGFRQIAPRALPSPSGLEGQAHHQHLGGLGVQEGRKSAPDREAGTHWPDQRLIVGRLTPSSRATAATEIPCASSLRARSACSALPARTPRPVFASL